MSRRRGKRKKEKKREIQKNITSILHFYPTGKEKGRGGKEREKKKEEKGGGGSRL